MIHWWWYPFYSIYQVHVQSSFPYRNLKLIASFNAPILLLPWMQTYRKVETSWLLACGKLVAKQHAAFAYYPCKLVANQHAAFAYYPCKLVATQHAAFAYYPCKLVYN